MRRPFDPEDGWPEVTTTEWLGTVLVAILVVLSLWGLLVLSTGLTPE